jgi:hypothetical protein
MFPLSSTFRLILVRIGKGVGRGVSVADSRL